MLEGPATESITAFAPPVEKAPSNFTSLKGKSFFESSVKPPIFEKPTVTREQEYTSPSMIEIPSMEDFKNLRDHATPLEGSNPGSEIAQNQFEKIIEEAMRKNEMPVLPNIEPPKATEVKTKLSPIIPPKPETNQPPQSLTVEGIRNFIKNFFDRIRSAIR